MFLICARARAVPDGFTPERSPEGAKRWRDIWSAGQGVGLVHEVKPVGAIVEDLAREAHEALKTFGGRTTVSRLSRAGARP